MAKKLPSVPSFKFLKFSTYVAWQKRKIIYSTGRKHYYQFVNNRKGFFPENLMYLNFMCTKL